VNRLAGPARTPQAVRDMDCLRPARVRGQSGRSATRRREALVVTSPAGPRVLLDTSAYAQFRRGHPAAVEVLVAAERVFLSTVTLGELEAGFALGSRPDENRHMLRDFLDEPFVTVVPVDREVARRYGALFSALRRAGTPIPTNDIWIAATALHAGAQVVTFDADFTLVPDLDTHLLAV